MASPVIVAFSWSSLNPLSWLGDTVAGVAADAWKAAMIGLWSAGLWMLELAFKFIDAFTTPDLSGGDATSPLGLVLPITLTIGGSVAVLVMFIQLGAAFFRRDGQSLGRVLVGIGQYGLVIAGYLFVGASMLTAANSLTTAILNSTLHAAGWSDIFNGGAWPRKVEDATVATVLGVSSILLLVPAAFAYLMIMLAREAALIILVVTTPITAAGMLSDFTKTWFWKSARWFIASLMISPVCALVVGIGIQLANGVLNHAASTDPTIKSVGTALVSTVIIAIGAVSPMVLFKLLAFVEPGTSSGAALRQSWSDAGGMAGVMSGGKSAGAQQSGSSAATESNSSGQSAGEGAAESQTQSRLMSALGAAGGAMQTAARVANKASDLGSDLLAGAGVGHGGYEMGYADAAASRRGSGGSSRSQDNGQDPQATPDAPSAPPAAPMPPQPMGPPPTSPAGPSAPGGGGGGAAASGGEAAAAADLAKTAAVAAL